MNSCFQTLSPQKPMGWFQPDFTWSIHRLGELKAVQMVLTHWQRLTPCCSWLLIFLQKVQSYFPMHLYWKYCKSFLKNMIFVSDTTCTRTWQHTNVKAGGWTLTFVSNFHGFLFSGNNSIETGQFQPIFLPEAFIGWGEESLSKLF